MRQRLPAGQCECCPGRSRQSNSPVPSEGSWWSRSVCKEALLNDVPGVHLRDVIAVWIWNLLFLLHRQGGRLRWLWLFLFLLLPRDKATSPQDIPQGQAQDSRGKTYVWHVSCLLFSLISGLFLVVPAESRHFFSRLTQGTLYFSYY